MLITKLELKNCFSDFTDLGKSRVFHLIFNEVHQDSTTNFMGAFVWAYASFFVWDRRYSKAYACSLEFMQRYVLNLHPEGGGSKSPDSAQEIAKVNTLYKKLKKFCAQIENPINVHLV